ncbi:hypothetical protein NWE55_11240 [Myroides albus]|uniref:DUF6850 family outer membrane beta-barrel protein n=1 Tax=Myroides albus TaxID=2562892 RepID=UPI0021592EB0|nr:DUF6850 family outer membrane beta-barrel protein [Myroides albus]UVD78692.1 hypothetical protein NWE55_11240 [Myroides albus]
MKLSNQKIVLAIFFLVVNMFAQENRDFFSRLDEQYSLEKTLQKPIYYNPAFMSDYSIYSFSDFQINYNQHKKDDYLLQEGGKEKGFAVQGKSYKKLSKGQNVWGEVAYRNFDIYDVQWNLNVDKDKIEPYFIADSSKGDRKYEVYFFKGGYVKSFSKIDVGTEFSYEAKMGYGQSDPRPKSTSSDLKLNVGASYKLNIPYKVGLYAQVEKYNQDSSIDFASLIEKSTIYQMTGFSDFNSYFSYNSMNAIYYGYTYKVGGSFKQFEKNNLYAGFAISSNKLHKAVTLSTDYDINRLETNAYQLSFSKFFDFDNHRLGILFNQTHQQKDGYDIYYTNNKEILTKLLGKKQYKYKIDNSRFDILYTYKMNRATLSLNGVYELEKVSESKEESPLFKKITAHHFGLVASYNYKVNNRDNLMFTASVFQRKVSHSKAKLYVDNTTKESLRNWLDNDFKVVSNDYQNAKMSLRYNHQIDEVFGGFIGVDYNYLNYSDLGANNSYSLRVGITF